MGQTEAGEGVCVCVCGGGTHEKKTTCRYDVGHAGLLLSTYAVHGPTGQGPEIRVADRSEIDVTGKLRADHPRCRKRKYITGSVERPTELDVFGWIGVDLAVNSHGVPFQGSDRSRFEFLGTPGRNWNCTRFHLLHLGNLFGIDMLPVRKDRRHFYLT